VKEDVLEQLVDDYLRHKGCLTRHNIRFRPRADHPAFKKKLNSNDSDIDIIAINPRMKGPGRVWAVTCKS
jgi:hypothetical protein